MGRVMQLCTMPADVAEAVAEWMAGLTRAHDELGRKGPVCPFVRPADEAGAIRTECLRAESGDGIEELVAALRRQVHRFGEFPASGGREPLDSLVTVMDGLPRHRWRLLDAAQRRIRREVVAAGLMVGQFHPECPEPGYWNPSFMVSRSPVPLIVLRRMAFHDILFLHSDPALFAEYDRRFGRWYQEGKVPAEFRALYDNAPRLPAATGRPYLDYQSIPLLHALHQPRTEHQPESSFYLAGQSMELLFSLVLGEVRAAQEGMVVDDLGRCGWHLRRATAGMRLLCGFWDLLSTLSPAEFNSFRDALGEASGLGSYKYRTLEFALGAKSPAMAARHDGVPAVAAEVYRALHDASAYDDALGVLVRRGLLADDDAGHDRDPVAVRSAWARIYREETVSGDLVRWAEALMDLAETVGRWRRLHLLTVERIIGYKPGTGGTAGVEWLRDVATHHVFPELWEARLQLSGGPA
ncbi:tryptophan 2,3-dioxygenase [Nocardia sp. BMG51109]|uniref:tryptophan 2,3-dioxygenase n=1 Tax=Nocardia sp. BMG51109 TaxID=1056816 RepID=UPI0004B94C71|nr:tryptophan 2,3-dioxygenase family protein [Nocardia sp. BMG51109]